jgi:NAD(P)-dependent dehydrogenase (short-subunit alcohol dehydrogenase family)
MATLPWRHATERPFGRSICVAPPENHAKPIVLITGAAGNIGRSLATVLAEDYRVIWLDRPGTSADLPLIEADLASDEAVAGATSAFRERFGDTVATDGRKFHLER